MNARQYQNWEDTVLPFQLNNADMRGRVTRSLSIYSAKDIAHMTTPEGTVTADCQFCGAHYVFDPGYPGVEAAERSKAQADVRK